jgi:hypothetical protein
MAAIKYTDASHNVLYSLDRYKWIPDLEKSAKGDVTGYQEANLPAIRTVLREFCAAKGRGLYAPVKCGNPISWNKDVFGQVRLDGKPVQGVRNVHPSAISMGVPSMVNPERDFSFVGLRHKQANKTVLRINVHPLAGATKDENNPDQADSVDLTVYKDWGVAQYWLDVLSFTAKQMSTPNLNNTMARLWDVISIGGDYNAYLDNAERWYYPGSLLPALFVQDSREEGLDHLQHAHGSDVKQGKRWVQSGNTDHNLHFVTRTFVEVPDQPRDF